jgi:hypothetical protein
MSDLKYLDVFRDPRWLLDNLFRKYKVIRLPTNGGWGVSNAGSGGVTQYAMYLGVYTGVAANSRGLAYATPFGLNSGGVYFQNVDWTKWLEIEFIVMRADSDSECVARVQLKESPSEGPLAQRGIGVEIRNYTMYGEAYGTARGTVAIGTLTDRELAHVRIVKTSSEVQFWVNRVLAGRLTGSAVPNVVGTTAGYPVISIVNGATGGVNVSLQVGNIIIVQEW